MIEPSSDRQATHVTPLATAVAWANTSTQAQYFPSAGPVLELGMGDCSTPLLHSMCKSLGIPLVSIDTNREWHDRFVSLASRDHRGHQIRLVPPANAATLAQECARWDEMSILPQGYGIHADRWSVALVDHAPGERRLTDIARLAYAATIIVVHDTEEPGYMYETTFDTFKHRFDYKGWPGVEIRPWTTVLSNFVDVTEIFGR